MKKIRIITLCLIILVFAVFIYSKSKITGPGNGFLITAPIPLPDENDNEDLVGEVVNKVPLIKEMDISDTSSWKEYTNEKYGFKLMIPNEMTVTQGFRSGKTVFTDSILLGGWDVYLPSSLDPNGNPNAKSLEDYKKDYQGNKYFVHINDQAEIKVNGVSALKQVYSSGEIIDGVFKIEDMFGADQEIRYVLFDGKNKIIILPVSVGWSQDRKSRDYVTTNKFLDTVVSTFEFI